MWLCQTENKGTGITRIRLGMRNWERKSGEIADRTVELSRVIVEAFCGTFCQRRMAKYALDAQVMPLVYDFDPSDKEKAVGVRLFESIRCLRVCDLKSIRRY